MAVTELIVDEVWTGILVFTVLFIIGIIFWCFQYVFTVMEQAGIDTTWSRKTLDNLYGLTILAITLLTSVPTTLITIVIAIVRELS